MQFRKDPFDTSILGQDVYKIILTGSSTISEVTAAIGKIHTGILYSFTPANSDQILIMEKLQFHLVSIRNTYMYVGSPSKAKIQDDAKYSVGSFKPTDNVQSQDIDNLATPIYRMNRYYKDVSIPTIKSKA